MLMRPGGRALIGSVPLAELRLQPGRNKVAALASWLLTSTPELPHNRFWKLRSLSYRLFRRLTDRRRRTFVTASPPVATIATDRQMIDGWLRRLGLNATWKPMRIGIPLHAVRADIVVEKPA